MEKDLSHSKELDLIDRKKNHEAVELMVDRLGLAAGSTADFNLYKVVEDYFTDLEKRDKMNHLLNIKDDAYELRAELGEKIFQ